MKSPKPYLFDSGLTSFLSGHYEPASLHESREAGPAFEGLILQHIEALCQLITPRPRLHYWRTIKGREVDVVIERGRALVGLEIKLSSTAGYSDTQGIRAFAESTPGVQSCAVIYTGTELRKLAENTYAIPWNALIG
jgi:hypothetical protein